MDALLPVFFILFGFPVGKSEIIGKNLRTPYLSARSDENFFSPSTIVRISSKSREKRSSDGTVSQPGALDVTLESENTEVDFYLKPNNVLVSPHFKIVVREKGKTKKELKDVYHKNFCYFIGQAKHRSDSFAALSNCNGKGFTGVLIDGSSSHMVLPLPSSEEGLAFNIRRKRQTPGKLFQGGVVDHGLHIIQPYDNETRCALFNLREMVAPRHIVEIPPTNGSQGRSKRQSYDEAYEMETAVFVDDALYKIVEERSPFGDVIEEISNVVFAIVNGVHLLYNSPTMKNPVVITLVRLDIIKSESEGPEKAAGEIKEYLSSFCQWQKIQNREENPDGDVDPNFWDHALMLSGLNLYDTHISRDTVIGLAWVEGMCSPSYSCTINEGTSFESVFVIAHEIGHNYGMSHDGQDGNSCEPEKYIMSKSTGPGKVTWSHCSNQQMEDFIMNEIYSPTCIFDNGIKSKALDFARDDELPGEIFSLGLQCEYAYGPDFSPYVRDSFPYEDICREVWCQNGTHAVRLHPALEGTTCAYDYICSSGKCTKRSSVYIPKITSKLPPSSSTEATTASTTTVHTTETTSFEPLETKFRDLFNRINNFLKKYLFLEDESMESFFWQVSPSSPCSVSCGGGWTEANVECSAARFMLKMDNGEFCDPNNMPPNRMSCNTFPCS